MYPNKTAKSVLVAINTTNVAPINPKIKLSLTPSQISYMVASLYSLTIFLNDDMILIISRKGRN